MTNGQKENLLLKIRKALSIGEWKASLLGLSKSRDSSAEAGLVFVQIDGFARVELNKALAKNEMPFLKKLLTKEKYKLYPYYSGLPSTTPSIQGELFYGVKQVVPAFFFFDRKSGKVFKMFDGDSVRAVEKRLAEQGRGLLEEGSSYSNIFTGGAKESHFCAASLGWDNIWKDVNVLNFILLFFTHLFSLIRMTLLSLWESVLALMDFAYGLLTREDPAVEFKFVPIRVLLCILLRELITLGAEIDVARGLPIVHLNFIGYDEQAHRRGPSSQTAHWALKGIDASIARIYRAALRSSRRHYDVWIYSDHGQEATIPYVGEYHRTVEEAVAQVFHGLFPQNGESSMKEAAKKNEIRGIQFQRIRYLGQWIKVLWPFEQRTNPVLENAQCITAAMGPLGHVYVFREMNPEAKDRMAAALVQTANIPLVLTGIQDGKAQAWNARGRFILPDQGEKILNPDHPFYNEVIGDLVALCHHPNAGTFVISGWKPGETPYSFPFENGAHAGPGEKETNAFALLPVDVVALPEDRAYLKTTDLREAALRLLKRSSLNPAYSRYAKRTINPETKGVRIMTYNVHSCIGMDGKISPQRIARVIGSYAPDIVALQELDLGRLRTGAVDQPHLIARELEMLYHFHPSIKVEEERYGNAVLSRYPMDLIRATGLPKVDSKFTLEPRGALWVSVAVGDIRVQIINTHLSLYGPERECQARALLSQDWIGHADCPAPAVLCGDFNCLPRSGAWRAINQRLGDAQHLLDEHRPLATWFGHYPLGRIDHVFLSSGIKVSAIEVPRTELTKSASDHLPLIVDLEIL